AAGDTGDLGHVRGEHDIKSLAQRIQHRAEGADAALAGEIAPVIAGATDGPGAEPFRHDRINFAVAVTRNKNLHAILRPFEKRREKMLTMPDCDNGRKVGRHAFVEIRRFEYKARRVPDKTQIFRRDETDGF